MYIVFLQMELLNSPVNGVRCISVDIQDGGLNEASIVNISRINRDMTKLLNELLHRFNSFFRSGDGRYAADIVQ